jgi:hypothetical protein
VVETDLVGQPTRGSAAPLWRPVGEQSYSPMSTDTVHGCCTLNEYFMSFSARTFLSSTSIHQLCAPRTLNSSYISTTILILLYFLQVTSSLSFPFQLPSFSFYLYHYHNLSSLPKNNIVNIIYKSQFIKTNNSFMFSFPPFFPFPFLFFFFPPSFFPWPQLHRSFSLSSHRCKQAGRRASRWRLLLRLHLVRVTRSGN